MIINDEQYCALLDYIADSEDEIIGLQMEEFEEEDFLEWCQITRRLQGDICGQVTLQFFMCPDCGRIHGLIEVVKE